MIRSLQDFLKSVVAVLQLAFRIGWRYVRSSRDFLKSVAALAMVGLALSIAILVIVQAVLNGFEDEISERILGIVPHISMYGGTEGLDPAIASAMFAEQDSNIVGTPVIESLVVLAVPPTPTNAEVQEHFGVVQPSLLTGMDPETFRHASNLPDFVEPGVWNRLQPGSFAMLLGATKAAQLGVEEGDWVTVVKADTTYTLLGMVPRQKRFRVAGIIDTNTFLDAQTSYVHLEDAARFNRLKDVVTAYKVQLQNPFSKELDGIVRRMNIQLTMSGSNAFVRSWYVNYGYLYRVVSMSRNLLLLTFSLLVAVATFNLVSTVVVFVNQRRQDIAVIRTLGGNRTLIGMTFLISATFISLIGLLFGCVGGWVIGTLLELGFPQVEKLFGMNLMSEYVIQLLRIEFALTDILIVCGIGLGISLLAAVYPAFRAARLDPAEVLRHD